MKIAYLYPFNSCSQRTHIHDINHVSPKTAMRERSALLGLLAYGALGCLEGPSFRRECTSGGAIFHCARGPLNASVLVGLPETARSSQVGCLEFDRTSGAFVRGWSGDQGPTAIQWSQVPVVKRADTIDVASIRVTQRRIMTRLHTTSVRHSVDVHAEQPFFVWSELMAGVIPDKMASWPTFVQNDGHTTWANLGAPMHHAFTISTCYGTNQLTLFEAAAGTAATPTRPIVLAWLPATETAAGSSLQHGPHIGVQSTPFCFQIETQTTQDDADVPESLQVFLHADTWSFRASASEGGMTTSKAVSLLQTTPHCAEYLQATDRSRIPLQRALWGAGNRHITQMYMLDRASAMFGNMETPNLVSTEGWVPFVDAATNTCAVIRKSTWAIWAVDRSFHVPLAGSDRPMRQRETVTISPILHGFPRLVTEGIPVTSWLDRVMRQEDGNTQLSFLSSEIDAYDDGIWTFWKVPPSAPWTATMGDHALASWSSLVRTHPGVFVFIPLGLFRDGAQFDMEDNGRIYGSRDIAWTHADDPAPRHRFQLQVPWDVIEDSGSLNEVRVRTLPPNDRTVPTDTLQDIVAAPLGTSADDIAGFVVLLPANHTLMLQHVVLYDRHGAKVQGHFVGDMAEGMGFAFFLDNERGDLHPVPSADLRRLFVELTDDDGQRLGVMLQTWLPTVSIETWLPSVRHVPQFARHWDEHAQLMSSNANVSGRSVRHDWRTIVVWSVLIFVFVSSVLVCAPCIWIRFPFAHWSVCLLQSKSGLPRSRTNSAPSLKNHKASRPSAARLFATHE